MFAKSALIALSHQASRQQPEAPATPKTTALHAPAAPASGLDSIEQTRLNLLRQLWQAALTSSTDGAATRRDGFWITPPGPSVDTDLLTLLQSADPAGAFGSPLDGLLPGRQTMRDAMRDFAVGRPAAGEGPQATGSLGKNAAYAQHFEAASARTGLPVNVLVNIIGAEAQTTGGVWNPASRNPRSSATGLSQFLDRTWLSESQRSGTWLNAAARERGYLTADGRVDARHRQSMLNLRLDPHASIQAAADYARQNLALLRQANVLPANISVQREAEAAYLAHHLGAGDAIRFLKGTLPPERARVLLEAQIGTQAAARRISAQGNAAQAHRHWLNDYVARKIDTA